MNEPLLNPLPEAIRRLGFGRSKVYEEIAAGNLHVVKVGRRTLIAETELQRYVRQLTEESDSTSGRSAPASAATTGTRASARSSSF